MREDEEKNATLRRRIVSFWDLLEAVISGAVPPNAVGWIANSQAAVTAESGREFGWFLAAIVEAGQQQRPRGRNARKEVPAEGENAPERREGANREDI